VNLSESSVIFLFAAIQSSKFLEFSWKFLHINVHAINPSFCLLNGGTVNKAQLFVQTTQWLSFICIPFADLQIIFDAPLQIVVACLPSPS
jgi:hypothetical protein